MGANYYFKIELDNYMESIKNKKPSMKLGELFVST